MCTQFGITVKTLWEAQSVREFSQARHQIYFKYVEFILCCYYSVVVICCDLYYVLDVPRTRTPALAGRQKICLQHITRSLSLFFPIPSSQNSFL